jgi:transcriptional antiterminator Rof (Rho-off)
MPTPDDYQPVACSFYDELGLRMMRSRPCTMVVENGDQPETVEAVIQDLRTDGDAEYVCLDDGRRIRLDRIRRVDDVERASCR